MIWCIKMMHKCNDCTITCEPSKFWGFFQLFLSRNRGSPNFQKRYFNCGLCSASLFNYSNVSTSSSTVPFMELRNFVGAWTDLKLHWKHSYRIWYPNIEDRNSLIMGVVPGIRWTRQSSNYGIAKLKVVFSVHVVKT